MLIALSTDERVAVVVETTQDLGADVAACTIFGVLDRKLLVSTALLATISGECTAKLPLFARVGGVGEIPVTDAAAFGVLVTFRDRGEIGLEVVFTVVFTVAASMRSMLAFIPELLIRTFDFCKRVTFSLRTGIPNSLLRFLIPAIM